MNQYAVSQSLHTHVVRINSMWKTLEWICARILYTFLTEAAMQGCAVDKYLADIANA